ncbi:MAG: uroporphyrinogen-III C-methyltransferase [Methanomassiliicoccales archaeon]|nr:uroporphyrinogen-III C-methyltransferase [Methanomassiliicoccales archaeon]
MNGKVFLVGAGPGDPGLMTLRGMELLRSADAVVYDSLANEALLKEARAGADLIDVGKRGAHHKMEQEDINRLLVQRAREGLTVVRLKGGDPFLFGRGAEEVQELRRAGVEVHVVPGVTSAIAAPELAGVPVTHREHASLVTFVTGNEGQEKEEDTIDWSALARTGGTIVILMGMANLERNMRRLMEGGMEPSTSVAVVHRGSSPSQRTVVGRVSDIGELCRREGIGAPSVVVVGSVATLAAVLGDLR